MASESYIPTKATQQVEFLKKYPEYDGRGIKMAIIDYDIIDPSLPGMQKTSTGLPKIFDVLDKFKVTVDTSTVVETQIAKKNIKFIIGLSGRKLNIPKSWKNISDKWHIGSVPFKELKDVCLETDEIIECKVLEKAVRFHHGKSLRKNESKAMKDKIIDCIVWFDGEKWRACIDTSFLNKDPNLARVKVLTNYENEYEFAFLDDKLIYCVNICDNGNSLNLMYPHDDHATQVAHVAAGYFPGSSKTVKMY
uniref:Uncharacterized protein n=1 Tax=Panagrolaimus sp. ES5 TaxID=591445 RepID=A0AC34FUS6_9BILA